MATFESASLPGISGTVVVGVVGRYCAALLVLTIPSDPNERAESGAAEHGDLE